MEHQSNPAYTEAVCLKNVEAAHNTDKAGKKMTESYKCKLNKNKHPTIL